MWRGPGAARPLRRECGLRGGEGCAWLSWDDEALDRGVQGVNGAGVRAASGALRGMGRRRTEAGGSLRDEIFFLLRTALKDRPTGPPTANRQLPSTANRHQPPTTNRHQPPPTASGDQPPTANHCQPPPTTDH